MVAQLSLLSTASLRTLFHTLTLLHSNFLVVMPILHTPISVTTSIHKKSQLYSIPTEASLSLSAQKSSHKFLHSGSSSLSLKPHYNTSPNHFVLFSDIWMAWNLTIPWTFFLLYHFFGIMPHVLGTISTKDTRNDSRTVSMTSLAIIMRFCSSDRRDGVSIILLLII